MLANQGLGPWIIFTAVMLFGALHSTLASLRIKRMVRRLFGPTADRVYRLAFNLAAGLGLLPVLALVRYMPDRHLYTIPFPWTLLTLAVQALAILILIAGVLQTGLWSFLGLRQLVDREDDGRPELVVRGLYRWVRHPLYTAGLILIWLVPGMTFNLLALNLGLTVYILAGAILEERKLSAEFGEAYSRYKQRTPMLITRPFRRAEEERAPGD